MKLHNRLKFYSNTLYVIRQIFPFNGKQFQIFRLTEIAATVLPFSFGQRSWVVACRQHSVLQLTTIMLKRIHPLWCTDNGDPFLSLCHSAQTHLTYSILQGLHRHR